MRLTPGATYKLVVRSAEEAVQTIRQRFGDKAKVLSVRQLPGQGLSGLLGRPKLEVIAQIPDDSETPALTRSEVPGPVAGSTLTSERLPEAPSLPAAAPIDPRGRLGAPRRPDVDPVATPRLPELLRRSGFSESLVGRLQTSPEFDAAGAKPLHHALADFGQALRSAAQARPSRPLTSRVAFLGSPGSGRTTALSKWLAREVFANGRTGRVIKAEFDRPNPGEGLAVFCEALGLSLEHYAPGEAATLGDSTADQFLYVDLPGLVLGDRTRNAAIDRFLREERIESRVLVLNAVYDAATLRSAYTTGRELGATHLVFTHLDELGHWGKLWDFLIDGELSPLFLATGPSLTGDLEENAVNAVLRKTLPGA